MKNRGLYGQSEGNEQRSGGAALAERLDDNDLIEGQDVAVLRARFKEKNWTGFNAYVAILKGRGHSQTRIESMMTRAMAGVRI